MIINGDTLYTYNPGVHKQLLYSLNECKYNALQMERYAEMDSNNQMLIRNLEQEIQETNDLLDNKNDELELEKKRRVDADALHAIAENDLRSANKKIRSLNFEVKKSNFKKRIWKGSAVIGIISALVEGVWIWILRSG